MAEYTYKAFISYSWADAKWGKWLQHAIETYRTPKALIEKHAETREIPARLTPLFKDREEQAAGASIGASIEAALADSEYLIVICSPNSAKSQWVNHEIAWFKTNRNPDKILALIVDGEPGDESRECFPKALTHTIAPDLSVTDTPDEAPLAADARNSGDGKRLAKMKLVAAMLGVGLDQLLRRDDRRRVLRARVIAGASLSLALVMSGLTWFAVEQRNEARQQRADAESLAESTLTDLRGPLESAGRLDALEVPGRLVLEYYAKQDLGDLNADSLGRRARAMLFVGEVSNIRGDSEEALHAFTEAAATTQEQLARDPENEQRIFDHAQSVFWVGAIAYGRGELDDAEAQFREYKRLADRLIELNPDKPEWQMESSYAETNLGVMMYEQRRYRESEGFFKRGLASSLSAIGNSPFDAASQVDLGTATNWVGLAEEQLGKSKEALEQYRSEALIYESVLEREPTNTQAKNRLAIALQFVGGLQLDLGQLEEAIATFDRSLAINSALLQIEPSNTEWQETAVRGNLGQAKQLIYAKRLSQAKQLIDRAGAMLRQMRSADPENKFWSVDLQAFHAEAQAMLASATGNVEQLELQATHLLELASSEDAENISAYLAKAHLMLGDLDMHLGRPKSARHHWNAGHASLPAQISSEATQYALLKRMERLDEAKELAESLDRRGFKHPAYLKEK